MHCLKDIEDLRTVITIGNYDGVHLGHRALLMKVIERAKATKSKSVVLTFNMHPYHLLHPHMKPYLLNSPEQKEKLLLALGIDYVCSLEFTSELADMSAESFLKEIIIDKLKAIEIVLGYDARFGKDRRGDYHFLRQQEIFYGYKTINIDSIQDNSDVVSSSLIRRLIREGDLEKAARLLSYHYCFKGTVTHGKGIGHKISFPTLNIKPDTEHQLIPGTGIYLTGIIIEGRHYWGATNVGFSPTLKTEQKLEIEMFVFDFNSNIYGQQVEIEFYKKLRNEEKYDSVDELIAQIKEDVEHAKSLIPLFSQSKQFGSNNG